MRKNESSLLNYSEVLQQIEGTENHLLLGNGFNRSLGVNTSYSAIFQKMKENNYGLYKEATELVEKSKYDLESFIGKLNNDIDPDNTFLRKYVRNKVKFDFMQATHEIVKAEIKNVYAEHNEGIFLLLKNFTNYFTLNYDSFLYLLLLKYKPIKNEEQNAIVFQPNIKFIEEDLNKKQNNIYKEIKEARENGKLRISVGDDDTAMEKSLSTLTKTHFVKEVRTYSKAYNKGWKTKDIERVVKSLIEEENKNQRLENVDDGSRPRTLFSNNPEFIYQTVKSTTQNLFFLHGAFHIYREGKLEKKITQQTDKALYERLENILNSEKKEVVCIFQSNNKESTIKESAYLSNCLNKLNALSGKMVIIGSALSDNDDHIFSQIRASNVDIIYVSTLKSEQNRMFDIANKKFESKTIHLFDAESISYDSPNDVKA